jgi:hypothetical protein
VECGGKTLSGTQKKTHKTSWSVNKNYFIIRAFGTSSREFLVGMRCLSSTIKNFVPNKEKKQRT